MKNIKVDLSSLLKQINILQQENMRLTANINYEKKLREKAESENMELKFKIKTEYRKKKTPEERHTEELEYEERHNRGTTKTGHRLKTKAFPIDSLDEFKAVQNYILEHSGRYNWRNWYYFSLVTALGLRKSDIVRLKWSYLFDPNLQFRDYMCVIEKKNSHINNILITEVVKKFTKKYIKETGVEVDLNEKIFKSQKGDLNENSFGNEMSKMIKKASIATNCVHELTSHSMRHSFGTIGLCCGKDISHLSSRVEAIRMTMGHSSIAITQEYLGLTQQIKDGCRQAVSDFLMGRLMNKLELPKEVTTDELYAGVNKIINMLDENV